MNPINNYDYEVVFYKDINIIHINKTINQFKFPKDFSYFDIYNYSDLKKNSVNNSAKKHKNIKIKAIKNVRIYISLYNK